MIRKRFSRPIVKISKRNKFVITTLIVTALSLLTFLITPSIRDKPLQVFASLSIIGGVSMLLTYLSLKEDIVSRKKAIAIILLPSLFFPIAATLFYFVLPARWLTRLIMLGVVGVGSYATLLVQNIYLVSVGRSIKLLYAARTVGLLLSVASAFCMYYLVFSFYTYLPVIAVALFVITFIHTIPAIWSVSLNNGLSKDEILHIAIISLAVCEIGTFLTFWPIFYSSLSLFVAAGFLMVNFYTLVSLSQHWLENRLFRQTLWEYIWILVILIAIFFFFPKWGG
jgi:hypothetical protein